MDHNRTETKKLHMALTTLARDLDTATSKFLRRDGLTPTRFEILEELLIVSPDGYTQAEIARSLHMQPANVLIAVKPMIERGWIVRINKEFNRKEKLLTLSAKGIEEFPPVIDRYYRAMNKVYSDLEPDGLQEWIRRLRIRVNS